MKIGIISLLFLSSWGIIAQSQLSLDEAISLGLANNKAIQIASKQQQLAKIENTWARAGGGPRVNLNANLNNNLTQNNNPASFLNGTFYQSGLILDASGQLPLYTGGRIDAAKQQLSLNEEISSINLEVQKNTLIRDITLAYFRAVNAKENIQITKEIIALSKDRLAYGMAQQEYGKANGFEIRQLQDAIYNDSISLIQQELNYKVALLTLSQTIQEDLSKVMKLTTPISQPLNLELQVNQQNSLNQTNTTIKQLTLQQALALNQVDVQKSNTNPSLNLIGSVSGQENFNKFFGTNPNTGEPIEARFGNVINSSLGLSATYPLYTGGVLKSNITIAEIQSEIAQDNLDQTKFLLENRLETLKTNYALNLEILTLLKERRANAQINMEEASERYRLGQISSFDYRSTQLQWINASTNINNTLLNLAILEAEIDFLFK